MNVAVICEFSGTVRDAFIRRGHFAVSYDLLPSESDLGPHVRGDVREEDLSWADLVIAHPPCTHLASSGAKHFKQKIADGRQQEAIDFFMWCINLSNPKIAVENPVGVMSSKYRKPDQIIQPWQFGHEETKTTCLWLKGLPLLKPTKIMEKTYSCQCGENFSLSLGKNGCPKCKGASKVVSGYGAKDITSGGNVLPRWYNLPPSEDRGKKRSGTFVGMADAMAEQWGSSPSPAWIPCPDGCDDFLCTIHNKHTADCECPGIEEWAAKGIDPYTEGGNPI